MMRALITGTVYGEPQARTSQAGKKYATAKVKADSGKGDGGVVWCSVIAFGEQADRLLTLANGAALSISGKAAVNPYTNKQGEPAAGLSLVVDELATLKGKEYAAQHPARKSRTGVAEQNRDPAAYRQTGGRFTTLPELEEGME